MSKQLNAELYGEASAAWSMGFFIVRIMQETDLRRLKYAVEYEAEHQARKDRIAILNKQIQKVRND